MSYQVTARFGDVRVTIATDSDNPLDLDDIAAVANRQVIDLNTSLTEPAPAHGMTHHEAMRHDYLLGDE